MGNKGREGTKVRKTAILGLCAALIAAVISGGCATGAKGPSDEELIANTLNTWKVGMEEKDIEKLRTILSDEFDHYEWGNKEQMIGFLESTFNQGDLDNANVSLEAAQTKIEGDTATVYPVELTAAFGSATIEFRLKKEADGQWRAVGMSVEGV